MDRNPEEGIEIMCDTNIYLSPVPKEFEDIDVGDPIDEDLLDDFLNEFTKYYPKFELVTEIYDIYSPLDKLKVNRKYRHEIDVINNTKDEINIRLKKYNNPIYIEYLTVDDIDRIQSEESIINKEYVIIKNKEFKGYKDISNTYYFFTGGENLINQYKDYYIDVIIQNKKIEELINLNEEYTIDDFIGGKK